MFAMDQLFETDPIPTHNGDRKFAQVALEQGIDAGPTGLTYEVGGELSDIAVGDRVIVPLGRGNKPVAGHVIEVTDHCDVKKVKAIQSRDPRGLSLTADLIELAQWMSGYYCCPLGMVLATMVPAAVKRGTGTVQQTMVSVAKREDEEPIKLSRLQKAALEVAQASDEEWIEMKELADLAGARSVAPVKQLIAKGLLTTKTQSIVKADRHGNLSLNDLAAQVQPAESLTLNDAQAQAVRNVGSNTDRGFVVNLLHGVTGSGKTEVYLRIIEQNGGSAIVLVPEIALTPQTVSRFLQRFDKVAVLHSGLTNAQRNEQWRRIRKGEANIVVGARSAVFAPLTPSIIVVDEEHENSYKQDQLPRYHARDVAIKRAQILGIPVVLGSATPSLESFHNATTKNSFELIRLPQRVAGLKLPKVHVVDMTEERRKRYQKSGKGGIHLLSIPLENALQRTFAGPDRGQAMLLLNRRGYANYIACPDHACGWMMYCDFCDASMVFHKNAQLPSGGQVRCHHCQSEQLLRKRCPQCEKKVTVFGLGTQRVEEEISRKFPDITLRRMDSDTMRTGRDYHDSLEAFRRGEIDLLVGTQMIGKGLDFPNVRVVGVISADTSLHLPDFRAAERTFQLVSQVAGRCGRGEHPGEVYVQTFNPDDVTIQSAAQHDYDGFAKRELGIREEVGLPPVARMARIVVRDKNLDKCVEHARVLVDQLDAFNKRLATGVNITGPIPCAISRVAEFHRHQILMIAQNASQLQQLMTALRNEKSLKSDYHTAIDVDPVALM